MVILGVVVVAVVLLGVWHRHATQRVAKGKQPAPEPQKDAKTS